MAPKKINAKEFAKDVGDGMHDHSLMVKYELSLSQLGSILKKLSEAGLIHEKSLAARAGGPDGSKKNEEDLTKTCPNCGSPTKADRDECDRCGVVFSKIERDEAFSAQQSPSHAHRLSDEIAQSQTDKIAGYFYAEDGERKEVVRKKRLWTICTVLAVVVVSFLFALFGYSHQVVVSYTVGMALFIFLYYIVVLYYAFKQSILWGIFSLCFSPAAVLFVILNWNTIFAGKVLPRVWLALFVPLTILSFMAKQGFR